MLRPLRILMPLTTLAMLAALSCQAEPTEGALPPQGLLLLRNGQLLEGKITPSGDRFHVELPSGEVWVKAVDVEVHCRTLEEGYWFKRSAMPLGIVQSHLDLAQWCLQHTLLGHAADELRDALAVDPRHPRIELLLRRLQLAQQQKPPAMKPAAPISSTTPSAEELDRLVRGMPAGAVETFTSSIQPLLINSCTSAGCHGPAAEQEPRWVRAYAGRTTSRRLTQRNLHTTLTLIDREKPLESPLLTVPAQPHGMSKTAVFTDPQAAGYRQLVAWVQHVSQSPHTLQPASVASASPPLLQTISPSNIQRVHFEAPLPSQSTDPLPAENEPGLSPLQPRIGPGAPPPRSTPQRGELPSGFQPRDAFDPEIFNRRYFPGRRD
jgi:hypothetical protein